MTSEVLAPLRNFSFGTSVEQCAALTRPRDIHARGPQSLRAGPPHLAWNSCSPLKERRGPAWLQVPVKLISLCI